MQSRVLTHGMQFGPPSAATYRRESYWSLGGFPTTLPIAADSLNYCLFAARFGVLEIEEPLCHFNIDGARFSTTLPQKRRQTFYEAMTYYFMLAYASWVDRNRFPIIGYLRLLARQAKKHLFLPDTNVRLA